MTRLITLDKENIISPGSCKSKAEMVQLANVILLALPYEKTLSLCNIIYNVALKLGTIV